MNTPIDSKNAGLRNEKLVLSLLRQHGELSQAQLCRLAGLSSSTASYIVGRLRQKRLIREQPGRSSKRGAKPIMLRIHPRGQLVVGADSISTVKSSKACRCRSGRTICHATSWTY